MTKYYYNVYLKGKQPTTELIVKAKDPAQAKSIYCRHQGFTKTTYKNIYCKQVTP